MLVKLQIQNIIIETLVKISCNVLLKIELIELHTS